MRAAYEGLREDENNSSIEPLERAKRGRNVRLIVTEFKFVARQGDVLFC